MFNHYNFEFLGFYSKGREEKKVIRNSDFFRLQINAQMICQGEIFYTLQPTATLIQIIIAFIVLSQQLP